MRRCTGRIYDRNKDGDLDITDHTAQVAHLYQLKQATYSENKVYQWIQISDLRSDLIDRCRKHVRINRDNHPWAEMDELQLLQSAQLYQVDPETGEYGVTLAGVFLVGTDSLILQVCPAHRTDLILRKVNVDRYDDRDLVRTNLIESYNRIMAFIKNTCRTRSIWKVLSGEACGMPFFGKLLLICSFIANMPAAFPPG